MFTSLLNRKNTLSPSEWQKIPWDDPEFSRRMLAEHLTQSHDHASRRFTIIDQHVQWIHRKVLGEQPSRILDLGCGPGLYAQRLTALGHTCTGMDFSPASIAYAREQQPAIHYIPGDVRALEYGDGYDLAMMIFGELNAFSADEAALIVRKAHAALKPGGRLLLEVHHAAFIERVGQEPPTWYSAQQGLFSDQPYICLTEARYDFDCAATYHYVFDAETGAMQQYVSMLQAYTDDEYRRLLGMFARVLFYPSLTGAVTDDLFAIVAEK